ncbi:MAG: hypothetical protein K2R93_14320 [Gemmatimonadaceae bacterium]|nr:hypothetical protein [Gemmatimonadaceae bacterium]
MLATHSTRSRRPWTTVAAAAVFSAIVLAPAAGAQLATKDFLTSGDQLLVADAATGFEWLTPVYTKNLVYQAPQVMALH